MKRKKLLLLLTGYLCLMGCQESKKKEPELKSMNEGALLSKNFFFSLPYEETSNGAAIIQVVLKGKTYRFMIDTGAPLSLSRSLQKKLGFPLLQDMQLRDANGDTTSVTIVRVEHLSVGAVEIRDVPALILDLESPLFACDSLDGLIGSNFLRLLMIQFNKAEKKIYFSDKVDSFQLTKSASAVDMQLNEVQSDPILVISLGRGVRDTVLFDTGDPYLYHLSKTRFDRFQKEGHFIKNIIHRGTGVGSQGLMAANTDTLSSMLVRIDSFGVGAASLRSVISMQQYDSRSRMGRGLWDYGVVTMDYRNQKFYFTPYKNDQLYKAKPDFGFKYQERNGKLMVTVVWKDTEAYRCGMKPGNEILQFGTFIPASVSKCNWNEYTNQEARKNSLRVTFENEKGVMKQCTLRKILYPQNLSE